MSLGQKGELGTDPERTQPCGAVQSTSTSSCK